MTVAAMDGTRRTGELFGDLWGPYDDQLFEESVALFERRLERIGFDPGFFAGKRCLDAGCGGGRNAIAMARLGAAQVQGIDIGAKGIEDARRRAVKLDNVSFDIASLTAIPFPDAAFDVVWCAGVLMHTFDEERVLEELARVLKPGGTIYMLVYATGGMRWPLIKLLRPMAAAIGQETISEAMALAGTPANKRRTFLDDLFVPKFDFFEWDRLAADLNRAGFEDVRRWPRTGRLDHEHDMATYRADLASLQEFLGAGRDSALEPHAVFAQMTALVSATIRAIDWFAQQVDSGALSEESAMEQVVGQGHHRLFATREGG